MSVTAAPASSPLPERTAAPASTPLPGPSAPPPGSTWTSAAWPGVAEARVPRLTAGVELLGEFQGSGYKTPPYLVRRGDGQIVQLSRLLYLVAAAVDGRREVAGVAAAVSARYGRRLDPEQADYLIAGKLVPRGIVAVDGGPGAGAAAVEKASPLLALRAKRTLLPGRVVEVVAAAVQPLLVPPVLVGVIGSVLALDYWLFFAHGPGPGLRQVLGDPLTVLVVLGLTVLAALFHECGHAAGCRYGGARPGPIGVGIYLVWPAFFTDVTDSYRLGRAGRLRTDLGGVYFNLVFILALGGLYATTGNEVLLLTVIVSHFEIVEQLVPIVRFDGYFILSDLVGVPDLFARVLPILRATVRRNSRDPKVADLHTGARIVITAWVLCVIPLLAAGMLYWLLHLPQILRAVLAATDAQLHLFTAAVGAADSAAATLYVVTSLLLVLPIVGSVYVGTGVGRRLVTLARTWARGHPRRRALTVTAPLIGLGLLALSWTR